MRESKTYFIFLSLKWLLLWPSTFAFLKPVAGSDLVSVSSRSSVRTFIVLSCIFQFYIDNVVQKTWEKNQCLTVLTLSKSIHKNNFLAAIRARHKKCSQKWYLWRVCDDGTASIQRPLFVPNPIVSRLFCSYQLLFLFVTIIDKPD